MTTTCTIYGGCSKRISTQFAIVSNLLYNSSNIGLLDRCIRHLSMLNNVHQLKQPWASEKQEHLPLLVPVWILCSHSLLHFTSSISLSSLPNLFPRMASLWAPKRWECEGGKMWAVWWVWKNCPFEFLCKTHIAIQLYFDDPLRMRDNAYCSTELLYQAGHLKLTTEKCRHFPWIWTEV